MNNMRGVKFYTNKLKTNIGHYGISINYNVDI